MLLGGGAVRCPSDFCLPKYRGLQVSRRTMNRCAFSSVVVAVLCATFSVTVAQNSACTTAVAPVQSACGAYQSAVQGQASLAGELVKHLRCFEDVYCVIAPVVRKGRKGSERASKDRLQQCLQVQRVLPSEICTSVMPYRRPRFSHSSSGRSTRQAFSQNFAKLQVLTMPLLLLLSMPPLQSQVQSAATLLLPSMVR